MSVAETPTTFLNKAARKTCHAARDAFYSCVREQGVDFAPGAQIPLKCKLQRTQFEDACPASWLKHFDELQEANARRAKYLAATINRAADKAAGSLSGKA
ncbi:hypothetical protein VOLCADRAFT_104508 [Volvox carteri f. nagariensis]|uniref:Cytochrome c oxidase, subunit VIb n=1 Tax=Volvox carteri f. nagariensis TaxID=3068 RepID=D8TU34_VOLCA|nr:uncharacterized protein VOLCADRAFT_104508 [Volvox carteri f. nagariensis]EFJ48969.1 hypothetical protein VOLCADRAFT_104508 [Volvox carteri f. nagariensis]|eukprot:XP_002949866.1 hypothetical protein VOLCADRAFT_104508 [Volvox carteri f. nagariensis]